VTLALLDQVDRSEYTAFRARQAMSSTPQPSTESHAQKERTSLGDPLNRAQYMVRAADLISAKVGTKRVTMGFNALQEYGWRCDHIVI